MNSRFKKAVQELQSGKMIVLFDEHREAEADIIIDAKLLDEQDVNLIISEAKGLLCLAITAQHAKQLQLRPQSEYNTSLHSTAFTVSVDATNGCTTGVTAKDRAHTIHIVSNPQSRPEQLARPGHIFPIIAHEQGIKARKGHTEAAIALTSQYDPYPSAAICEILNKEGNSSNIVELREFVDKFNLSLFTIEELFKDYEN